MVLRVSVSRWQIRLRCQICSAPDFIAEKEIKQFYRPSEEKWITVGFDPCPGIGWNTQDPKEDKSNTSKKDNFHSTPLPGRDNLLPCRYLFLLLSPIQLSTESHNS